MSVEGVLSVGFCPGAFWLSQKPKWTYSPLFTEPLASAGNGSPEVWVTREVTKACGRPETMAVVRHVGFEVK